MVEEPLPSAQSQFTQSPQQTPPVPDPTLNPGRQFQGSGRGRGGGSRGRGSGGQRNNRYNAHVQKTNVSGGSNNTIQKPKTKCTICEGKHNNLMFCKELTKYLPCGSNQKTPPPSICSLYLCTEFPIAKQSCSHKCNRFYQQTLCPASNKHFLLCTECAKHMPALQYLRENHKHEGGWTNFALMRGAFGDEAYKAMCATVSVTVCNSNSMTPAAADDETFSKNIAFDETDSVQIWPAQSHNTNIEPYMAVNG